MPQFRQCNEVCDECINKGYLVKLEEVDTVKIQHMVSLAQSDLNIARALKAIIINAFSLFCVRNIQSLTWIGVFFEKIRTKRNGIQYYGKPVTLADWKEAEIQFNLYLVLFKKIIEEKLKTEK